MTSLCVRLVGWMMVTGLVATTVWTSDAGALAAEETPSGEEAPAAVPADPGEAWRAHSVAAERALGVRDFAKAEAELAAALKVAEAFPDHDERLAASLARLMQIYAFQDKYAEAVGTGKRLLAFRESADGPKHINVAGVLNALAGLYLTMGKSDEAGPLLERARAICTEHVGRSADRLHAGVLENLAELHRDKGNLEAAEPLARQALALRRAQYGPSHRACAESLEMVGTILLAKGQHAEAEAAFRESLAIRRMKMGWNRPVIIRSLVHLADACKAQEKYQVAENYYKEAIRQGEGGLGPKDNVRADAFEGYADLLRRTDRAEEAETMAGQAKTIREELEK